VHDYYVVNPSYGTKSDLLNQVSTAHKLGFKVMFDEVLNHTSWDHALIRTNPDYYVHTDGSPKTPIRSPKRLTMPT
jgi:glycosidase